MPGAATTRTRRSRILAGVVLACAALPACGEPPDLHPPGSPVPSPSTPAASASTPVLESTAASPSPSPSASPGFAESAAVNCAGRPSAEAVLAVLRAAPGVLPAGGLATVATGPLCAGTWQYSIVRQGGREPLQVVTRTAPDGLTLVTAGTDVCTARVRTTAPPGIRVVAGCAAPVAPPTPAGPLIS